MIRVTMKGQIAPGKGPEALKWARQVADYVQNKIAGGPQVKVFAEAFGDYGTIHWQSDYENLQAVEKVMAQTMTDQGYRQMLVEAGELFMGGSAKEKMLVELP